MPKRRRRRGMTEPALRGLVGEANIRMARGDTDTAEKMFHEVITQNPYLPEPYEGLATLYEGCDQPERALLFDQLAAHMKPGVTSGEEWARLGADALKLEHTSQAADCYRRAVSKSPGEPDYLLALAGLMERRGDRRRAVHCYRRLLGDRLAPARSDGQTVRATRRLGVLLKENKKRKAVSNKFYRVPWKERLIKVKCGQCGLGFRAAYHLVRHTRAVHDKVKKYQCDKPECGRQFGSVAGLRGHRIRGHGEKGPHACTSCGLSYAKAALLAEHVSRIHLREKRHVCKESGCGGKAYVWGKELQAHRRRVHGLALLQCTVPGCSRTEGFVWQSALSQHNKAFHKGVYHQEGV